MMKYIYPHLTRFACHVVCTNLILLLLVVQGYAQSDRPCNSPVIPLDECTYSNVVSLRNTSFQADAPLTTCAGNYTRDGWFRFIAPSNTVTVNRSLYCESTGGGCSLPGDPGSINTALYVGSPNCSNLTLVDDCPTTCFMGIGCATVGPPDMAAAGYGDFYTGLTPGQPYFLRVMWDSVNVGAPDTIIINIRSNAGCTICLPCGLGFVSYPLATSPLFLKADMDPAAVRLSWEVEDENLRSQDMEVLRNVTGASDAWESLAVGQFENQGQFRFTDLQPPAGEMLMYRIAARDANGAQVYSNLVQLRGAAIPMAMDWTEIADGVRLKMDLPEDGLLEMHGMDGQLVDTQKLAAGPQEVNWLLGSYPAGIYVVRVRAGQASRSLKVRLR